MGDPKQTPEDQEPITLEVHDSVLGQGSDFTTENHDEEPDHG